LLHVLGSTHTEWTQKGPSVRVWSPNYWKDFFKTWYWWTHRTPTLQVNTVLLFMYTCSIPCHVYMFHTVPCTHVPYRAMYTCSIPCHVYMFHTVPCIHAPYRAMYTCSIPCHVHMFHTVPCTHVPYRTMYTCSIPYHVHMFHTVPCNSVFFIAQQMPLIITGS
jgi:hypothetical protein